VAGRKMKIQCPNCGHKENIRKMALDDEIGFPHWGYPVCTKCGTCNEDYKCLYRLYSYVDAGYLSMENAVLTRVR
jgi:uncharacterized Zn finger protein